MAISTTRCLRSTGGQVRGSGTDRKARTRYGVTDVGSVGTSACSCYSVYQHRWTQHLKTNVRPLDGATHDYDIRPGALCHESPVDPRKIRVW